MFRNCCKIELFLTLFGNIYCLTNMIFFYQSDPKYSCIWSTGAQTLSVVSRVLYFYYLSTNHKFSCCDISGKIPHSMVSLALNKTQSAYDCMTMIKPAINTLTKQIEVKMFHNIFVTEDMSNMKSDDDKRWPHKWRLIRSKTINLSEIIACSC